MPRLLGYMILCMISACADSPQPRPSGFLALQYEEPSYTSKSIACPFEFDDEDVIYSKINDSTYVFEGKTPLKDLYKILSLTDIKVEEFEANKGEAETLAGFVLESAKGFPKKGQIIKFKNYDFTVEALDSKRIVQLKVKINKDTHA